jgi:hypothetical protein
MAPFGGSYLLYDVERFLDDYRSLRPDLIFTSPPFSLDQLHRLWLEVVFEKLGEIMPVHASMVVTLGNCWAPPVQTTDTLDLLKAIHYATGLDLLQMFTVIHDDRRMSSSVAEKMDDVDRAPDYVSYAWWFGRSAKVKVVEPMPSNVVHASTPLNESRWLDSQGYHAALPVSVPGFFVRHLTGVGDLVMDPFAGLNATGRAASDLHRNWLSLDTDPLMLGKALTRP